MNTNFFAYLPLSAVFTVGLIFKYKKVSIKDLGLFLSLIFLSLVGFFLIRFDSNFNHFQFVQSDAYSSQYDLYLGVDSISMYFIALTAFIMPVAIISNYVSISENIIYFVMFVLTLEVLLIVVFSVLDAILFYIFFESILPPLFLSIGLFGAANRIKAGFYLFLYTLLGSLFLLLAILGMLSIIHTTDYNTLFNIHFPFTAQKLFFLGAFIAVGVKTPVVFLNIWLLKAHVESPLSVSIILASIVLKLSIYTVFRIMLPTLAKACALFSNLVYSTGVTTVLYASLSTIRTIDVKELIAYSSVCHAAVYLLGVFSNCIQGIQGAIILALAHGLVSPGLFICAGGALYDRVHSRIMPIFRGLAQTMPLFAILFFILCLANCGAPLTFNFIGEFLSLYGVFEKSWFFGLLAGSSIVFSAAYSIFMYQRISLGGSTSRMLIVNLPDLTKREFMVLFTLVIPTVLLGIYPAPILEGLAYSSTGLLYHFDNTFISCDAPSGWGMYFTDSSFDYTVFTTVFIIILFLLGFKYYNLIINYLVKLFIYVRNLTNCLRLNSTDSYSFYLLVSMVVQLIYMIYCVLDVSLLSKLLLHSYTDWAEFINYYNMAYAGANDDGYIEYPKDYDGTVHRSIPEGERGTNGTNGATPNGATTNGVTTNGVTPNGVTTNGATTNGVTTNGATTNGVTTNGDTSNGHTNDSAEDYNSRLICPDSDQPGQGHVWNSDTAPISRQFRCHFDERHPACDTYTYYFCTHCSAYSCSCCL